MDKLNTAEIVRSTNPTEMSYIKEELDSETSESRLSVEAENSKKQGMWSELPSVPLEMIYSFLCRQDQVNMSLVCSKWSEGYNSPSVWKTYRFELTLLQLSTNNYPGMKFVRKYSGMFRHVEIYFHVAMNAYSPATWCRHLIDFLDNLIRNSQLISVKFENLLWCFVHLDFATYADVNNSIAKFLRSQNYLKRLEFHYSFVKFKNGVDLLKEVNNNSKVSITRLELGGLIYYEPDSKEEKSTVHQSLIVLADFPNLITLETDYSSFLEYMFERQCAFIKSCDLRNLSKLILNYDADCLELDEFRGLTSTDWRFLKKLKPDLKVELKFSTNAPSRRKIEFIIMKEMPITRLNYTYEEYMSYSHDSYLRGIPMLFEHLVVSETNCNLESLCLKLLLPISDIASTLIPFLHDCNKLKNLQLEFDLPNNGIDVLLDSWLNNRPNSLKNVLIVISSEENDDDYEKFTNVTYHFVPCLELVGLNVKVAFDNLIDRPLRKKILI